MTAAQITVAGTEVRYRTNSKGQTYPQWYNADGEMVGCGCDEAKGITVEKYHFTPCHHRREHNAALETITGVDFVQHIEDDLNSCALCGYLTKGYICHKCC